VCPEDRAAQWHQLPHQSRPEGWKQAELGLRYQGREEGGQKNQAEKGHMLTASLPHTELLMTRLHLAKGKDTPKLWS